MSGHGCGKHVACCSSAHLARRLPCPGTPTPTALISAPPPSWVACQVGVGFKLYRHPADAFEQRQLIATVPHRRPLAPAWVHDFPATATHAVIPEMPLYFNVGALMMGGKSGAYRGPPRGLLPAGRVLVHACHHRAARQQHKCRTCCQRCAGIGACSGCPIRRPPLRACLPFPDASVLRLHIYGLAACRPHHPSRRRPAQRRCQELPRPTLLRFPLGQRLPHAGRQVGRGWGGVGEWGRAGVLEEAWERLQTSSSMKEATSSCWPCVHRWLAQLATRNRTLPCAPPPPPPRRPRRLLHLDACLYEDPQIVNDLYLEPLRAGYAPGVQPGRAYLRRLTLDLDAPDGGRPGGRGWHHAVACRPAAVLLSGGAAGRCLCCRLSHWRWLGAGFKLSTQVALGATLLLPPPCSARVGAAPVGGAGGGRGCRLPAV